MGLLGTLAEKAPFRVFASIVLGGLAGVLYALLIPLILSAVPDSDEPQRYGERDITEVLGLEVRHDEAALLFFVACLAILAFRTISQVILARVSMQVTADLRRRIYRTVLDTSVRQVERVGTARIQSSISMDVGRIVLGARLLPDLVINLVTLCGMLFYLFVLDDAVFRFVTLAVVLGAVSYLVPLVISRRWFRRSAEKTDALYEYIAGLLAGLKELKINRRKETRYYEGILGGTEDEIASNDKRAHTVSRIGANYGDMISFFVIGILAFVFVNYQPMSTGQMLGVLMVLLYLTTPVAVVIDFAPQISLARVSLRRIEQLLEQLSAEDCAPDAAPLPAWQRITLHEVAFHYEESGFHVGPLSLEIPRGSLTFLVGGNGSGKSTLARLLSLHYRPDSGEIRFGETPVTRESLVACRQQIAAIHSDFHLFEELLDQSEVRDGATIAAWLQRLDLAAKVTLTDGRFSTTRLSSGQRKRLALLVSCIDDKELYVFDEWAADQDPQFKEVFYLQILADLKARGKTIVLCSHDDRYFHVADRIVRMENGQLSPVDHSPLTS